MISALSGTAYNC